MTVIIGFFAGLLGGLIGTGGCSVMLPILHFYLGYSAPQAIGTTLFAVIFTALSGGLGHFIRKNVDVKAALWLGVSGALGVVFGSYLFNILSEKTELLGFILGLAFLLPSFRMIWEGLGRGKTKKGDSISENKAGFASFGLLIGIPTGLVGLGGGYALVPGLIYLFGAPVYITMGTSLAVMFPLALIGGMIKLAGGYVVLKVGILLAIGTIAGAQLGAMIIKRFKPTTLKLIFGLYFLYVSLKFINAYFGIKI